MKKIGIDARLYTQTGVGTYIRNLLYYLSKQKTQLLFYIYHLPNEKAHFLTLPTNFILRDAPYRWHTFAEQGGFLRLLIHDNLDLMHFTYFGYPILYKRPYVATIHDLTPVLFKTGRASTLPPFIYYLKQRIFEIVLHMQYSHAKKIITPSYTVGDELMKYFGEKSMEKIVPIYEGLDYELENLAVNEQLASMFAPPFFIYIGNFYPHKNIHRLIDAFVSVRDDLRLILVGPNDFFSSHINQKIQKEGASRKVIVYHPQGKADIAFFYKHAQALIHPSLSEGFGLPLVEAMYYGCPIIASDIPVFKELLGQSYIQFKPNDVADIAQKINSFTNMQKKTVYHSLLKRYSFSQMTEKLTQIYKENS